MTRHLLMEEPRLENVRLTLSNREVTFALFWFIMNSFAPLNLPEL